MDQTMNIRIHFLTGIPPAFIENLIRLFLSTVIPVANTLGEKRFSPH